VDEGAEWLDRWDTSGGVDWVESSCSFDVSKNARRLDQDLLYLQQQLVMWCLEEHGCNVCELLEL